MAAQRMSRFRDMKGRREPIAMLTCYDYPTATLEAGAGIDGLLVGDSVGTNVLGYQSELDVTIGDIVHHVRAVRRGAGAAYVLADLPYGTYDGPEAAVANAHTLLEAGADGVKFEGVRPEIAAALHAAGIEACAHLGLNMQSQEPVRIKGKTFDEARALFSGALAMERAGVGLMVLELVPAELAALITERLAIPTIGIGAGPDTDGQVLVVHDLVGLTARPMRHAERRLELGSALQEAFRGYRDAVRARQFPTPANFRSMARTETERLRTWVSSHR